MKTKILMIASTIAIVATLIIAGIAWAASLQEANSPDCNNSITINKVTEPSGGMGFKFTLKYGTITRYVTLNDLGTQTYTPNSWSVFTITEDAKDGYQLKDIACTATTTNNKTPKSITYDLTNRKVTIDLTNQFDGNVTCTFTNVKAMDYGDLPTDYGLTKWSTGARHYNPGDSVILGTLLDQEWDGQPNSVATGDNIANLNDEDGVVRGGSSWGNGSGQVIVTVTDPTSSGKGGCLMGWLDYYGNGDFGADGVFSDTLKVNGVTYSEKIIDNLYVPAGRNTITFTLPSGLKNVGLFARFRLSPYDEQAGKTELPSNDPSGMQYHCNQSAAGLTGLVIGGEVEDYAWVFGPTAIQLQSFHAKPVQASGIAGPIVAILAILSLVILWTIQRKTEQ